MKVYERIRELKKCNYYSYGCSEHLDIIQDELKRLQAENTELKKDNIDSKGKSVSETCPVCDSVMEMSFESYFARIKFMRRKLDDSYGDLCVLKGALLMVTSHGKDLEPKMEGERDAEISSNTTQ